MPRPNYDTPYRDDSSAHHAAPSRETSPRRQAASTSSSQQPRRGPRPVPDSRESAASAPPKKRRSSRRRRGAGAGPAVAPRLELTSHPTSRTAYLETRVWLLAQHGPVCAYCGRRFTAGVMTLDHVAPRRGQTAYDRRDNLVLACPGCNMLKRDLPPLAFLLGARGRAANLLRYGSHLSQGLLDLARSIAPAGAAAAADAPDEAANAEARASAAWAGLDDLDDEESPYRD